MPGLAEFISFSRTKDVVETRRDMERMSNLLAHTFPCSEEVTAFDNGALAIGTIPFTAKMILCGLTSYLLPLRTTSNPK
ncbi:MAG: hypothetical protein Q8O04_03375 [Deltaproteobacteria bacterium]|nr:hypothetical protein [Deltaproteobacteria bacterium]